MAALAGGWAAWQQSGYPVESTQPGAARPVVAGGEMSAVGKSEAPVVIVEFSDFQCGYCAEYALATLPKIKEAFVDTGLVYYLVRDFPLEFHANARLAAQSARCAGAQGQYWPMHDLLYTQQFAWSGLAPDEALSIFQDFAAKLALDPSVFKQCVASGQFQDQIDQDVLAGRQAGVGGTPSFLINGELMVGAYPFETFEARIKAALERGE